MLQTKSLLANGRETKVYVLSNYLPIDTLYREIKITDTNKNANLTTIGFTFYTYITFKLLETFEVLLSYRIVSLLYKSSGRLNL